MPYDYGSLMHYHAVAHAIRVSDFTIVPKELKYVTTMGTERMAFLDAKVINDIYCPREFSFLLSITVINNCTLINYNSIMNYTILHTCIYKIKFFNEYILQSRQC